MRRDLGPETPTPLPVTVGHPANRELHTAVGNLLVEARQHLVALKAQYVTLQNAAAPVPQIVAHTVLNEYRRHEEKTAQNLAWLATMVEG